MADAGLKTRPKYSTPDLKRIQDEAVKKFGEDLGNVLFNAFRDIYDDLKLLLTRQATLQSPAKTLDQITANQNNYSVGDRAFIRLSSDASRDITGIVAGSDGARLLIANVGSQNIVLKHQSASSSAANRILSQTGGDVTIAADGLADLIYDSVTQRWRV